MTKLRKRTATLLAFAGLIGTSLGAVGAAPAGASVPGIAYPSGLGILNGAMQVFWNAPSSDGGSAVTGYTVTAYDGSSNVVGTCSPSSLSSLQCTVTGLTNGTPYTFTVIATNADGDSAESPASSPAAPSTTPDAPSSTWALIPGDGTVDVGWYDPAWNGGSDISGYTVTASPGGATCTYAPGDTPTFSPSGHESDPRCTVSGLSNGTSYSFSITATNFVGSSSPYEAGSATPVGSPSAPSNVSVLRQFAGNAVVTWSFASSDGGSAITSYVATASPGGQTCSTFATWNECTIYGLDEGQTYTFTVAAVNAVGTGPSSGLSAPLLKNGLPDAPTNVTVAKGKDTARVSWTKPSGAAALGYSSVRGYLVTASPGGQQCYTKGATKASCVVVGLVPGVSYRFSVQTWTLAGLGAASAQTSAVQLGNVPGAPKQVKVTSTGAGKALVTWLAPASNGGVTITSYLVTSNASASSCTTAGLVHECEFTGLPVGFKATFSVKATNLIGTSSAGRSKAFKIS